MSPGHLSGDGKSSSGRFCLNKNDVQSKSDRPQLALLDFDIYPVVRTHRILLFSQQYWLIEFTTVSQKQDRKFAKDCRFRMKEFRSFRSITTHGSNSMKLSVVQACAHGLGDFVGSLHEHHWSTGRIYSQGHPKDVHRGGTAAPAGVFVSLDLDQEVV